MVNLWGEGEDLLLEALGVLVVKFLAVPGEGEEAASFNLNQEALAVVVETQHREDQVG